jgi:hypothetical protein
MLTDELYVKYGRRIHCLKYQHCGSYRDIHLSRYQRFYVPLLVPGGPTS